MNVSHYQKADDKCDDTPDLYLVIRVDAASHIVGNLAVEDYNSSTSDSNE